MHPLDQWHNLLKLSVVGGGLLGGALLADAFDDNNNDDCYDNGGFGDSQHYFTFLPCYSSFSFCIDDGGGDFF